MVSFMGGKSSQNRGASVPKIAVWRSAVFCHSSGDSFSWRCWGSAIRHGSKNKQNFNLMCSVLFRLMYRYFMLQWTFFVYLQQNTEYYLCLIA
jgi:hypothetical protein